MRAAGSVGSPLLMPILTTVCRRPRTERLLGRLADIHVDCIDAAIEHRCDPVDQRVSDHDGVDAILFAHLAHLIRRGLCIPAFKFLEISTVLRHAGRADHGIKLGGGGRFAAPVAPHRIVPHPVPVFSPLAADSALIPRG